MFKRRVGFILFVCVWCAVLLSACTPPPVVKVEFDNNFTFPRADERTICFSNVSDEFIEWMSAALIPKGYKSVTACTFSASMNVEIKNWQEFTRVLRDGSSASGDGSVGGWLGGLIGSKGVQTGWKDVSYTGTATGSVIGFGLGKLIGGGNSGDIRYRTERHLKIIAMVRVPSGNGTFEMKTYSSDVVFVIDHSGLTKADSTRIIEERVRDYIVPKL